MTDAVAIETDVAVRPTRQSNGNGAKMALQSRVMPSIQIKNVPPEVHNALRRRAAAAGQSMQEYLLAQLTRQAEAETLDEVLDRIGSRSGSLMTHDFIVESIREERERRS
jgi:plasmid stability protein